MAVAAYAAVVAEAGSDHLIAIAAATTVSTVAIAKPDQHAAVAAARHDGR